MRCAASCFLVLLLLIAPQAARAEPDETLLLQQPTISAEHIVFVYAQDLWVVGREGGDARRLTSNIGVESAPQLSPDGRTVAFSGQYDGNVDVYVIPVTGGTPVRRTWHPGADVVVDWHPDGERVLFRSARASSRGKQRLFLVGVEGGGLPETLPVPKAAHASYDADASHLAYTPFRDAFGSWKRYRGGTTPPIWLFDLSTYDVEQVPHENASDTWPCWLDGAVIFASDRSGRMNLHRYVPGSEQVEQLTDLDTFDVTGLDAGAGAVVFAQGGALHLLDPAAKTTTRLKIRVRADGLFTRPRWEPVKGAVRAASIAPNGKRAVFEARGEIVTVPKEHGDARNLTRSPGAHDRDPAWSPDGKSIAWFSDEGGEYRLRVADRLGRETPKAFDLGDGGFYADPRWSPDGKHVLFEDKKNRIAFVTLETGEVTEVARLQGSLGVVDPIAAWSPDSKWIAFEARNPRTLYDHIALYEVATGEVTRVTDGFGLAGDPAFSGDGKHLFFTASVDVGPRLFGLDMGTSASRPWRQRLYAVVLAADGEHPLAPRSDEAVADDDDEKDDEKKDDDDEGDDAPDGDADEDADDGETADDAPKRPARGRRARGAKKKPVVVTVDLDGIDQRIVALPVDAGRLGGLRGSKQGVYYLRNPSDGPARLEHYDLEKRKERTVASRVDRYDLSADGKWLLTRSRGAWSIRAAAGGGGGSRRGPPRGGADGDDEGPQGLAIDRVKVRVEPRAEWRQILREVWRIQRDYFYDENMHGVDWPAMWTRWSPFLAHVAHREDLNGLIYQLIGELACGHQYGGGGDLPDAPDGVSVGLLGADWEIADGAYRIAHIYRGQNWNPGLRAPLTEPGVDARVGDTLLSVDGRPVTAETNLYEAFENTAGRQVEIRLVAAGEDAQPRTMTVVPVASEGTLRQLSWIEANRKRVDELSDGRLAYVYMPNTGRSGMAAFDRDFYSQLDKDGLILDERYNGGGQVANYVIDVLARKVMSYWMNREKWLGRSPWGMIDGPKVMIINESAGSGGDWMPWMFQRRGLGPLVGTRTWGGLVGISGYPPLMDGGGVTAASFGVMDENGQWAVENVGVAPDHEVIEWPKAVIAGGDPQLEKAVALALEALEKNPPKSEPVYVPPAKR